MMKRWKLLISMVAAVVLCLSYRNTVHAYDERAIVNSGDWKVYMEYNDDGTIELAAITGYTGTETDLILPAKLTVKLPFGGQEDHVVTITGVISRNGYWEDVGAFYNMTGISSVVIPEGYTYLDRNTFTGCKSLSSVTLPSTLLSLGSNSFCDCISLSKIVLPSKMTQISDGCFWGCTSLASVTFPDSLIRLEEDAFNGCTCLTDLSLPSTVTSIGERCFRGCSSLTTLVIPSKVISLGLAAFCECTSLTSVSIPASVKKIDHDTFNGCTSLTSITLPEGMTTLGDSAFEGCVSLAEISLPSTLVTIEAEAFRNCSALTSVVLPSKAVSLGEYLFWGCTSLKSVTLSPLTTNFPDGVFCKCSSLEEIGFSDKIVIIGENVFSDAVNLTDVTYSGTVEKWKKVNISKEGNTVLDKAVIHCSDGKYHKIHDFSFQKTDLTPATCTAEGTGIQECRCGEKENYTIAKLPHDEENMPAVAATCTTDGNEAWKQCKNCKTELVKKVVIPALGHSETADPAVAPTCTEAGKTAGSHCSRCALILTAQEAVPALGHSFATTYTVDRQATTKTSGTKSRHCARCTAVDGAVSIPAAKDITLSKDTFLYSGKRQKPKVSVKDAAGGTVAKENYSVSFPKNPKAIGKYTVTITFKGDYTGAKKLSYTIIPKDISIKNLKAGKKAFTINWKAASGITGYEIQYSLKADFRKFDTVTINKSNTVKTTISKLKAGKKYYVRLRSYKKVNGKKIYSSWSKTKSVTTLK